MKKIYYFLVAALMLLSGCSKDDLIDPEFSISTSEFTVGDVEDRTVVAKFAVNVDWTATVEGEAQQWLTLTPASGHAGQEVELTMTAAANPNHTPREANVVINYGGEIHRLTVTQSAYIEPELTIGATSFFMGYASNLEVRAVFSVNVAWTATIIYEGASQGWLTLSPSPANGPAGNDVPLIITAATNTTGADRQAKIVINYRDQECELSVKQIDNLTSLFDADFATALKEAGYIADDKNIKIEDVKDIKKVVLDRKFLMSVAGIEYFVSLETLRLPNNRITSINLSNCAALKKLDLASNLLESLDVSKNLALDSLSVHNQWTGAISVLDVSKNVALTDLVCGACRNLATLVLNTGLKKLNCSSLDALTSLDLTKCTALTELNFSMNANEQFTSIDLSKNTALTNLNASGLVFVTSLDLSQNTAIKVLEAGGSLNLASLDISKCTALVNLNIGNLAALTAIDLTKNTALTTLTCNYTKPASGTLDLSKNTALTKLFCQGCGLTSIDLKANTALTELDLMSNQLTSLDISKNTALTSLFLFNNPGSNLVFPITAWFDNNNVPAAFPKTWSKWPDTITAVYTKAN